MAERKIETPRIIVTRADAKAAGLLHYYTGIPCKYGHTAKRYTSTKNCIECQRMWERSYYVPHPRAKTEKPPKVPKRLPVDPNRPEKRCHRCDTTKPRDAFGCNRRTVDGLNAYCRPCAATVARERARQYPEENCARVRAWTADNPDKIRERTRRRLKENPEYFAAQTHKRRARKKAAEGTFTGEDIARIRAAQRDKCAICRRRLYGGGTIDHIKSLNDGGSNWPKNLQLLCRPCNSRKHTKDPIDYMRSLGRLL